MWSYFCAARRAPHLLVAALDGYFVLRTSCRICIIQRWLRLIGIIGGDRIEFVLPNRIEHERSGYFRRECSRTQSLGVSSASSVACGVRPLTRCAQIIIRTDNFLSIRRSLIMEYTQYRPPLALRWPITLCKSRGLEFCTYLSIFRSIRAHCLFFPDVSRLVYDRQVVGSLYSSTTTHAVHTDGI